MANKYIIHGAALCGDGTSPSEATVAGGVGAWNNINIFEGTAPPYGTLAAGDTVFIRAKDATNADIIQTLAANVNLGSASATEASPITWIIDNNGEIWAGVTGVVKYIVRTPSGSTTYAVTQVVYNAIVATARDGLQVINQHVSAADMAFLNLNFYAKNILADTQAKTSAQYNYAMRVGVFGMAVVENLHFIAGLPAVSYNSFVDMPYLRAGKAILINPEIELPIAPTGYCQPCFSAYPSDGASLCVYGGRLFGPGVNQYCSLVRRQSTQGLEIHGFKAPRMVNFVHPGVAFTNTAPQTYYFTDLEDSGGGGVATNWGEATSRSDNNPPVLNAQFPDSAASPWAWRVYPYAASSAFPVMLAMHAYSNGATAQKTITCELLVEASMAMLTKANTWLSVTYTDVNGINRMESARDLASSAELDASTAPWSATMWGMYSFNKRKISVTTQYPVKQGTMVHGVFFSTVKALNPSQVLFINPELSIV